MNPLIGQTVNLPGGIASGVAPGGSQYKTGAGATKITQQRNVAGQDYYNIDQTGIGGGTGWIAASALNGIAPNSAPAAPTAAPQQQQPQMAQVQAFAAPQPFDLIGATNAAYNSPELLAANAEVEAKQKRLVEATTNINDNPFFAEATRVGKIRQLTDSATGEMQVIQNKIANLKSDAAIKVAAAQGQYNINRQAYQDTLQQFNMILQSGGLTNASAQDLANYAQATGMSYSVLQSIQQQEKQKNITTQVIPSTDNAGNVTLTTINTKTGEIINQTSAGQVSKAEKVAAPKAPSTYQQKQDKQSVIAEIYDTFRRLSGAEGYVSKEDWAKMKSAAIATGGLTSSEFNSQFASFTNPNGAKNGYIYN